jgi:hypothetical protein
LLAKPKFDKLEKAAENGAAVQIADPHGFYQAQDGKEEEMRAKPSLHKVLGTRRLVPARRPEA